MINAAQPPTFTEGLARAAAELYEITVRAHAVAERLPPLPGGPSPATLYLRSVADARRAAASRLADAEDQSAAGSES